MRGTVENAVMPSLQQGELTPAMKVRRNRLLENLRAGERDVIG
jgi:hypothetical protein